MTEHSEAFKAQYAKSYGRAYAPQYPDFGKCAAPVFNGGFGSSQCSRKNGHGPEGAWCKQHDPIARKAKDEARTAELEAKWAASGRKQKFQRDCIAAIRAIADGHNDPRGLAQSIIDALEGKLV